MDEKEDEHLHHIETLAEKLRHHFQSGPMSPGGSSFNHSFLTEDEHQYLSDVLSSQDLSHIRSANEALQDESLFPRVAEQEGEPHDEDDDAASAKAEDTEKDDRRLQQELFKLHEEHPIPPSHLLSHMSRKNSILESERNVDVAEDLAKEISASERWNPFKDVASWIDGSEGVEVTSEGEPVPRSLRRSTTPSTPFLILGTNANETTCHPRVLTPPLIEALLNFVPEHVADHNLWLKYSASRDGRGIWRLLKHVRASTCTILAIQTTEGYVFGCFSSSPWRLAKGWYGNEDVFLWHLRHGRQEEAVSIVEQACRESEIQVFPFRHPTKGNKAIQYCSNECMALGQSEIDAVSDTGKHYGHALYLEPSLRAGTTSTSETFGNPCLVNPGKRGHRFEIANVEVWTLTAESDVQSATKSEMATLFLDGRGRGKLDLKTLLVGR